MLIPIVAQLKPGSEMAFVKPWGRQLRRNGADRIFCNLNYNCVQMGTFAVYMKLETIRVHTTTQHLGVRQNFGARLNAHREYLIIANCGTLYDWQKCPQPEILPHPTSQQQ